jgi:alanine racemase
VLDLIQLAEAQRLGLELVVHQAQQLALLEACRGGPRPPLWLKVDTGVNRLGFRPEEFYQAWQRLSALQPPAWALRVLRHLADADEADGHSTAAALAGHVSMNMIAVDVTDLPQVGLGDPVELWGERLPVEEVAADAGTVAYELVCTVSQRVPVELV